VFSVCPSLCSWHSSPPPTFFPLHPSPQPLPPPAPAHLFRPRPHPGAPAHGDAPACQLLPAPARHALRPAGAVWRALPQADAGVRCRNPSRCCCPFPSCVLTDDPVHFVSPEHIAPPSPSTQPPSTPPLPPPPHLAALALPQLGQMPKKMLDMVLRIASSPVRLDFGDCAEVACKTMVFVERGSVKFVYMQSFGTAQFASSKGGSFEGAEELHEGVSAQNPDSVLFVALVQRTLCSQHSSIVLCCTQPRARRTLCLVLGLPSFVYVGVWAVVILLCRHCGAGRPGHVTTEWPGRVRRHRPCAQHDAQHDVRCAP
jgi:hypothetical protein